MPQSGYILCTAPRSGSTMLCRMLTATGQAGDPCSFFRRESLNNWASRWSIAADTLPGSCAPTPAYLNAAILEGRAGTPVFGMRLMHENLPDLLGYLRALSFDAPYDRGCLEAAFGPLTFIHLEREDTVSQAISLLRAEQSGLWHKASDGSELEHLAPTEAPGYDFDRLHAHVTALDRQKAGWHQWFSEQGIHTVSLTYDQLSSDPAGSLIGICGALGIQAPNPAEIAPPTSRLRDHVTAEWKERYEEDARSSLS